MCGLDVVMEYLRVCRSIFGEGFGVKRVMDGLMRLGWDLVEKAMKMKFWLGNVSIQDFVLVKVNDKFELKLLLPNDFDSKEKDEKSYKREDYEKLF